MPAGSTKTRFGRCPYCRAMICQSSTAAIYYCTKCRTPIRGKNTEPTDDETDNALSSLEILSAVDTESVFSDELEGSSTQPSVIDVDGDQPPFSCGYNSNSDANSQGIAAASSPSPCRGFGSARTGKPRSNSFLPRGVEDGLVGSDGQDEVRVPANSRVDALRASSRRTRRASSASDPSILRRRDFSVSDPEEASRNASSGQQLRQSALSSRELRTSASVSAATASPLTDPAFQRDLLHALDKLRGMIANIELQPRSASGGSGAVTRRDSRLFRRLESRLAEELPADDAAARGPRQNGYSSTGSASWSSSASSSSGRGERRAARPRRRRHCLPVLGGAPFVVCGGCSELLHAPTSAVPSRRRGNVRLRCGGCEEVLEVALPAAAGIAGPARLTSGVSGSGELERAASRSGGKQQVPLLLHRALGYDSMSQLMQSRRY
ncbi:uncharacterized protein LOC119308311 [Triticum dicoccoides]|uniref:uncharacterized protein LOC119308311 n=1 Tax=Triticum dicoccoides TaxID=85692 RepID=UPI00188E86AB|nr:uncharacterized protein LOC119308311 [Triticum dicoccoides]